MFRRQSINAREQMGSWEGPDEAPGKSIRSQERQINRVAVMVVFIALFLGAAGFAWAGRTVLGIALGVAAGLAALATLLVPRIRPILKNIGSAHREPEASAGTGMDMQCRKRMQGAVDALLSETGAQSVPEALHQKAMVDAVVKRLSDLEQDKTMISGQIAQAMAEAGSLADKAGSLLRTAGFPVGEIMDETRMQEFQQGWQEYREDRNRIAQVNMTMESIAHEQAAVMRALSIPDDEEEEGVAGENGDAGVIEAEAASAARALPGLLEQLEPLGAEISTAQRMVATLETRLERVPTEDRLQRILEDMDRLDARRVTLQSYGESLHVALQVLRESALQLRQGISPRLDCLSGEIFSDMTRGRYRRIGTDDQLTVRVEVPEISEMPAIGQLSGGTAEQAWLAVRLAAVRLLEEGRETLPLFLDEPFAQFDEERTAASLEWLKRNAGNRQIFLFTCRNRDRELAESIFSGSVTRIALSPS